MKYMLILFGTLSLIATAGAQTSLVNVKTGTWKNVDTWLYQRIPSDSDDVVLIQDIVIDTNAYCRSLTTNGYNIIVASGQHLSITGNDFLSEVIDNDTLISKLSLVFYGNTNGGNAMNQIINGYEYDSLKRISKTIASGGFVDATTTYYYQENSPYPYKTIYTNPCDGKSDGKCVVTNDTSYYKYNAFGVVIQDSSRSLQSEYELNYKHTYDYVITGDSVVRYALSNTFVISNVNDSISVNEILRKDTTYYRRLLNKGNIVYQAGINTSWNSEHISTYGDVKNPLYRSSVHLPVLLLEMSIFDAPEQPNLMLTHEENYSVGYTLQHIKYKTAFRYKPNGLPLELIMLDEIDDTVFIIKYQYTN